MDAYDRCTNLGKKILLIVLSSMVEPENFSDHPCIRCVIWKMSPVPCNALYALFGAEQIYIMQTGNTDGMSRFNIKWAILYLTIFHRKSKTVNENDTQCNCF